jgi:hypothetical protein
VNGTGPSSLEHAAAKRTAKRFLLGFGWFTVAAVGALMVVGSVAVTVVGAWVQLGQRASDLSGPDTPAQPGPFFAAAFREAYGGLTVPMLMAVCGILLVLTGIVGGVLTLRRMLKR